ncbi:uncharacterized protein [Lolium perenne]|uniref:uncharacterized protein n=1 Tax=Lolium perenne TaxID=4522 RepID=UPI0021F56F98|nr:uncharacterized protein LOC127321291 [Lolium perenne]
MARTKCAPAAVNVADAAAHIADAAVHAADSARSASAATRCAAAAVAAAARHSCPASTEPEVDLELGTVESSSSSSSAPSSPSSSSATSTLQNFMDMFEWFDSWSGVIYQLFLTASMGVPVYPSYNHISKRPDPEYMLFFIIYCCVWICISTVLVFLFLGRSRKEKRLSLWMYRLYMMGTCISMILFIYLLIPHTTGVNLGAGILISSVVLAHMTAWNINLTYPCSTNESENNSEG